MFFFDEAHLLFDDAPQGAAGQGRAGGAADPLQGRRRLFRHPEPGRTSRKTVLGQLGNRVQHALRAFTPRDQRAVKAAAETFRANPDFDAAEAIQELAVGEALVSLLEDKGIPGVVQRAMIRPPGSRLGPITASERAALMAASPVAGSTTIRWTGSRPMSICATGRRSRRRRHRRRVRLRGIRGPAVRPPGRRQRQAAPAPSQPRAAAPRQSPGGGDGQQRAAQPWNAVGPADRAGYPGRHHEALSRRFGRTGAELEWKKRGAILSWCFYDWAMSAYNTVIGTFIFSVYFTRGVAESEVIGTAQWGRAVAVSGIAVAVLSPGAGRHRRPQRAAEAVAGAVHGADRGGDGGAVVRQAGAVPLYCRVWC